MPWPELEFWGRGLTDWFFPHPDASMAQKEQYHSIQVQRVAGRSEGWWHWCHTGWQFSSATRTILQAPSFPGTLPPSFPFVSQTTWLHGRHCPGGRIRHHFLFISLLRGGHHLWKGYLCHFGSLFILRQFVRFSHFVSNDFLVLCCCFACQKTYFFHSYLLVFHFFLLVEREWLNWGERSHFRVSTF